jgi:hypothetical protein
MSHQLFFVNNPPQLELIDFFNLVIGSHIPCLYNGFWLRCLIEMNMNSNLMFIFSPLGEQAHQGFNMHFDGERTMLKSRCSLKRIL